MTTTKRIDLVERVTPTLLPIIEHERVTNTKHKQKKWKIERLENIKNNINNKYKIKLKRKTNKNK